jgi:hypothetical protein
MAEKIPESDVQKAKTKRRLDFMKGQISVPDDFDTMYSAEIEAMFYGGKLEPEED